MRWSHPQALRLQRSIRQHTSAYVWTHAQALRLQRVQSADAVPGYEYIHIYIYTIEHLHLHAQASIYYIIYPKHLQRVQRRCRCVVLLLLMLLHL